MKKIVIIIILALVISSSAGLTALIFGQSNTGFCLAAVSGDADGDGEITDWDAILFERMLAGWNVTVMTANLDLDGDGEITDWDAIMLSRYLAGWPVELVKPGLRTASGVLYETSGGTSLEDGSFMINQDFTVTFKEAAVSGSFNRINLSYSSTTPLKVTVNYSGAGSGDSDSFFLDKGTEMSFRGLISGYLGGDTENSVYSLTFSTCTKKNSTFKLIDLDSSLIEVYNSNTYYIENSRFKVGVKLSWGGGINYIEDKHAISNGLTNLINQADTGRLVQQSYYGTAGNSEYTPGDFNGTSWTYNPVQGGDKYGNQSRLIDVEVTDNSIYVKAQPQDWSLDGQITPSYMENTYTLDGDVIRVDNRFTDYSGWEHRYSHQELPAFYTVSYLDTFTWYDGIDSWNDAPLSLRANLNFWGDPAYAESCQFYIKDNNTETWCAWYNRSLDYGIGLYVPNVDMLYAGRFSYNGSKDPYNGATNYVAPLNMIKMVSYKPIEYSYLITAGSVSEIRSVFKANKDFADNASLHTDYISMRVPYTEEKPLDYTDIDFSYSNALEAVTSPYNTEVKYDLNEKALRLTVTNAFDPQVMLEFENAPEAIRTDAYTTVSITYMIPENDPANNCVCDLFICAGADTSPKGENRIRFSLISDGEYHTAIVDLSNSSFWNGDLHRIRMDYFDSCSVGNVMYVKSVKLS
ncbi:MAG: dockerin type I repeat-containing protein [Clostridia bacterium]|nr:dockerin type I repeat-containing protein [Clostridia bacterium]